MEERSARRSLLHFFCSRFPSSRHRRQPNLLVVPRKLLSAEPAQASCTPSPASAWAPMSSPGERPRWGKSRTPPAALAMCRAPLRLDRVVRTPPALGGNPNAPWESPPLAKRLHTVAVAHRPAVQWNEKAICRPAPRASAASSPEPAPRRTASWPSARRLRILAHLRQASRVTDNPELI